MNIDDPIDLSRIDATRIFDALYAIFCDHFVNNSTMLNGTIYINPERHKKYEGKELSFWHLTTRTQSYRVKEGNRIVTKKERLPDYDRASRIHWVKPIIENHNDPDIKMFYKKETTGKKPIRLYLWAFRDDFVVILQKLGKSSSFLVTSFYITHQRKRDDFESAYQDYISGLNQELKGCEWF